MRISKQTWLCIAGGLGLSGLIWSSNAVPAAGASSPCRHIQGEIELTPVSGPDCTSPVGVCGRGQLTGTLAGHSFFIGSSLVQSVDTPSTAVLLLTGDNRIETKRGTLLTKDAVVLRTAGDGEFAEVDTIVGGTDALQGATGVFTATGFYDAANGGSGHYEGELCTP
jgi:hypothetical protein